MSKKNRARKEISAFESARAALERAGEIDAPEASEKKEASEPESVSAAPETSGNAENETASAVTVSGSGTPEASEKPDDAPASENKDAAPVSESADARAAETASDAPQTSDAASEPQASETVDASAPEASESAEAPATERVSGSGTPEASEAESETPDAATEASERDAASEPEFDGGASEVEETERHTMETREITLGRHRTAPPGAETEKESVKAPKEHSKRSVAQAFEEFKSAIRGRVESAEEEEEEQAASKTSRDQAIFQRVQRMPDGETKEYLLNRILPQMTWYARKSALYQTLYYRFMTAAICLGALIPVFAVGASGVVGKVIIALLGASVTGINAYLALHNYHNLWLSYRATREDLLHILYCYFNQAGIFSLKLFSGNPDLLLVNLCEDALSKETGGWKTIAQNAPVVGKSS